MDGTRHWWKTWLLHASLCILLAGWVYEMVIKKRFCCYSITDLTRVIILPCTNAPLNPPCIPPSLPVPPAKVTGTFCHHLPAQSWKYPKTQRKHHLSLLSTVLKPMFTVFPTALFPKAGALTARKGSEHHRKGPQMLHNLRDLTAQGECRRLPQKHLQGATACPSAIMMAVAQGCEYSVPVCG